MVLHLGGWAFAIRSGDSLAPADYSWLDVGHLRMGVNMKKLLTAFLAGSLCVLPLRANPPADPPPPQPVGLLGACLIAGGILVVGGIMFIGIKKMCDKIPDPANCRTNLDIDLSGLPTLYVPNPQTNRSETLVVEMQESLGGPWQEVYTLTFDRQMHCQLSKGGVVLEDNLQPAFIEVNGEKQFWYDLRHRPAPGGASGFIRIRAN